MKNLKDPSKKKVLVIGISSYVGRGRWLEENSIYYELLGKTQPKNLELDNEFILNIADLAELNSLWYKNYFKENKIWV